MTTKESIGVWLLALAIGSWGAFAMGQSTEQLDPNDVINAIRAQRDQNADLAARLSAQLAATLKKLEAAEKAAAPCKSAEEKK